MSRSKWKGNVFSKNLLKNRKKKIWCRNATIPFFLVDKMVFVHNGKEFKKVFISREKVGFKFGDFSFTRKLAPKLLYKKTSVVNKIKK